MVDRLRRPFLILALVSLVLALLVEIGATTILGSDGATKGLDLPTPGFGLPCLALIDGLLLLTVVLIAGSLLLPERVHGRIQGIVTLVGSILVIIGGILASIAALAALIMMVSLLLAAPFGTIAYMAVFASFNRAGAALALGAAMTLKLIFSLFLVLAHQRFLKNKSLVMMTLTSLIATWLVAFLHALPPRVFSSITDALAGLVVGILAIAWAVMYFLFAILSIIRVFRVDRSAA